MTDLPDLMQGAEPFFHRGNAIGCLIVHGYMASRNEVGWLGDHLAAKGYTVYIPRLTGHGINPEHMKRMRWQDFYAQVLDSYHILRQQCDRVIVIGHSMGGLLSILLATIKPIDGLVIVASPIRDPDPRMKHGRLISWLMSSASAMTSEDMQEIVRDEQRRRNEPVIGRINYTRWMTRALYELHRLIQLAHQRLPEVSVPTQVIYARKDTTVLWGDHEIVMERLGTADKNLHLLDEGGHLVFLDVAREEACVTVDDFIEKLNGRA